MVTDARRRGAERVRGKAAHNLARALIERGLAREVRARGEQPVWRRDEAAGRAFALVLTRAGRALAPEPAAAAPAQPTPAAPVGHVVGVQKAWDDVRRRATEILRARAEAEGKPAATASDLSRLRLHDLRHSYASFAVMDGAALFLVGKVLGHKQTRTTEIYAHAHDDPLRAVADRTGEKIAGMMRAGAARRRAAIP